jgi:bacillithiol system protein YtxJ
MTNNNWIALNTIEQLSDIFRLDNVKTSVIFKHSTSCSISSTALDRFERNLAKKNNEDIGLDFYLLDLLNNRNISNAIAEKCGIRHESPQALVILGGTCIYNASHWEINFDKIIELSKN